VVKADVQILFGISVRAWRGRLGLSQEELAERAGLHRTYVCDIERGARNVSLKSIEKLAKALEISLPAVFSPPENSASRKGSSAERAPILASALNGLVDILLVEDNSDDAELTMSALRGANISNPIEWVRDGAAALDFLFCTGEFSQRSSANGPQVVLLDLNLPKVSGMDVLRRIKADPRTRTIPVLVLTASKAERDAAISRRLGADGYIIKPVDFRNFSEVTSGLSLQWALLKSTSAVNT